MSKEWKAALPGWVNAIMLSAFLTGAGYYIKWRDDEFKKVADIVAVNTTKIAVMQNQILAVSAALEKAEVTNRELLVVLRSMNTGRPRNNPANP